jgi:hypothetical protein
MEPVPYEVREEDVDEVLGAYGADAAVRDDAVKHVMQHVQDIDDIVRTAPETSMDPAALHRNVNEPISTHPGDQSADRRELALGAIEEILIRDGFVEASAESRVFPPIAGDERR